MLVAFSSFCHFHGILMSFTTASVINTYTCITLMLIVGVHKYCCSFSDLKLEMYFEAVI